MTALRAVIVDDNRLLRDIVARTLEAKGIDTFQAEDGVKGWKTVEEASPHLVVIDVVLPGEIDGVKLCSMLRSSPQHQDTVIVMITASDKRREAERSLAAGADILISKPFSPKQFWSQVGSLLKDRRLNP